MHIVSHEANIVQDFGNFLDLISIFDGLTASAHCGCKQILGSEFPSQFLAKGSESSFVSLFAPSIDASRVFPIQVETIKTMGCHKSVGLVGMEVYGDSIDLFN